jgi:hypothetical protein
MITENEIIEILENFTVDLYKEIKVSASKQLLFRDYFWNKKIDIYSKYAKAIIDKIKEETARFAEPD